MKELSSFGRGFDPSFSLPWTEIGLSSASRVRKKRVWRPKDRATPLIKGELLSIVRRLTFYFLLHNLFLLNDSHGSYRCHGGTDFLGCFFSTHCSRFGAISSSLRFCYRLFSSLCSIVSAGSSDCGTVGGRFGLLCHPLTFIVVRLAASRNADHQGKDREERQGIAFSNERFPHRLPPFRRGASLSVAHPPQYQNHFTCTDLLPDPLH